MAALLVGLASSAFATGCYLPEPRGPLTRDLPSEFAAAEAIFDQRLKEMHPPGTAVSDLTAALATDRFEVDALGRDASRSIAGFPCRLSFFVRWTEADGRIESVEGRYGGICL